MAFTTTLIIRCMAISESRSTENNKQKNPGMSGTFLMMHVIYCCAHLFCMDPEPVANVRKGDENKSLLAVYCGS
jgi:hypothetical protein